MSVLGASSMRGGVRTTWWGVRGKTLWGSYGSERGRFIAQSPTRYINSTISFTTNMAHLMSISFLHPSLDQHHRSIPLAADGKGGDFGGSPSGAGAAGLGGTTTGSSSGARLGCDWILSISRFASCQASKFCGVGSKSARDVRGCGEQ